MKRFKNKGFTLVEVIVVIVIIGLLFASAMPSYTNYITTTKRSVAKNHLLDITARQEQYFVNNKSYADVLTKLGLPATYYVDEHGQATAAAALYQMTIARPSSLTFTVTAAPQGNLVTLDVDCGIYTLDQAGNKTYSGGGSNDTCW